MIEQALVIEEKNNNKVIIELVRTSACGECKACTPDKPMRITAYNNINAKIGNYVTVDITEFKMHTLALVYLMPIVKTFIGYFFGVFISNITDVANKETITSITAASFFLIYVVTALLIAKKRNKVIANIISINNN